MAPFAGTKIVTFHDSWPNFAKHFKLDIVGHVEPKPGIPPSPLPHARDHQPHPGPEDPGDPRRALLRPEDSRTTSPTKTGAVVVTFYPSVGGIPEIKDYFSLFDHNIDAFVNAVKGKK